MFSFVTVVNLGVAPGALAANDVMGVRFVVPGDPDITLGPRPSGGKGVWSRDGARGKEVSLRVNSMSGECFPPIRGVMMKKRQDPGPFAFIVKTDKYDEAA